MMNTALLLDMAADAAPDRVALGRRADGLSFEAARRRARSGAAWLAARFEAMGGGDNVAFVGLNGPALPVAIFAAGLLGKPFAPLNYRLPDADLNRLLARTAPSVVIVDDEMVQRLTPADGVTLVTRSAFEAACGADGNGDADLPSTDPDIAVLLFTSGTTGEPKAAILRHSNLTSYVISTVEFLGAEEDEAALVSVPPYHIAGISAVLTGVYGGRRLVHLEAFTPEAWVEAAVAEGITHAMVVPTMLGRILDILEKSGEGLPGMKAISYGGGRMPLPVIERALALLPHVDFVNAYGLTETSSTIAVLGPDDHRMAIYSDDETARRRLGSVGKPVPGLELEVRDPDGKTLGPNQSGEIYVRGEQVSGEYTHKKVVRDDGWFATNDGGWLDEEGYLFVEGRLDDVIVRGGENMSPGEIEDVLREHPQVDDVAVLGLPDNDWGEKVAAVIVARDGQPSVADLAGWVRARLRSSKTPEVWEFRDALPYNDTGKLLRRQLKAEMAAERPGLQPTTAFLAGHGGVRLAIDRWARPAAQPVILLHGGGQTRHAWGATGQMFYERGYDVLAVDMRGHGESSWSAQAEYDLAAFRDDVEALLGHVGGPAVLVGASLGGMAALLVAGGQLADQVKALVLVDVTHSPSVAGAARIQAFMRSAPNGFASLEDAADSVASYLPHRSRPRDPSGLMRNLRERGGRLHWHWDPAFISRTTPRDAPDPRLEAAARSISVSTLLVYGDESEVVDRDSVQALKALMPHLEVAPISGARHMVAGDQNTQFGRAAVAFIECVAPAANGVVRS